jgi:hypothetical protein
VPHFALIIALRGATLRLFATHDPDATVTVGTRPGTAQPYGRPAGTWVIAPSEADDTKAAYLAKTPDL